MTTEAQKKAIKKWKLNNPEKVKASNSRCLKRYYQKNKDIIKKKVSEYSKTEKGRIVHEKSVEKFNLKNPIKIKMFKRNWVVNNREKVNKNARIFQHTLNYRIKKYVHNMNRTKEYKEVSDGTVTVETIKKLYSIQNGKCALSGLDISKTYHIDHIIPISKGGKHTISNIQLLFPTINLQKSNKLNFIPNL